MHENESGNEVISDDNDRGWMGESGSRRLEFQATWLSIVKSRRSQVPIPFGYAMIYNI